MCLILICSFTCEGARPPLCVWCICVECVPVTLGFVLRPRNIILWILLDCGRATTEILTHTHKLKYTHDTHKQANVSRDAETFIWCDAQRHICRNAAHAGLLPPYCVNVHIIFNNFPLSPLHASLFAAVPVVLLSLFSLYNWIGYNGRQRAVRNM